MTDRSRERPIGQRDPANHAGSSDHGLERTGHELAATAQAVAHIAVELNAVALDLGGDREALRLRAIGLRAEAGRLALAALNARAAAEQIACAARVEHPNG